MILCIAGRRALTPDFLLADGNEIGLDRPECVLLDVSEKRVLLRTLNVHLQEIFANHIAPIRERPARLQVFGRPALFEYCHASSPACPIPIPAFLSSAR